MPQPACGTDPAPCVRKDTKGVIPAKALAALAFATATAFAAAGLPAFHGGGGGVRFGIGGASEERGADVVTPVPAEQLAPLSRSARERLVLSPQAQLNMRHIGQSPDAEEPEPSLAEGTTTGRGLFAPPPLTIDGSASNSARMSLQRLPDPCVGPTGRGGLSPCKHPTALPLKSLHHSE